MILADYVKCNNCEEIMYVVMTTEVCPNCLERGVLSFVDENNPEVEVSEAEVINLWNSKSVINEEELSIDDMDVDDRPENIVSCVYCSGVFNTEIENFTESEGGFAVCKVCSKIES